MQAKRSISVSCNGVHYTSIYEMWGYMPCDPPILMSMMPLYFQIFSIYLLDSILRTWSAKKRYRDTM